MGKLAAEHNTQDWNDKPTVYRHTCGLMVLIRTSFYISMSKTLSAKGRQ